MRELDTSALSFMLLYRATKERNIICELNRFRMHAIRHVAAFRSHPLLRPAKHLTLPDLDNFLNVPPDQRFEKSERTTE